MISDIKAMLSEDAPVAVQLASLIHYKDEMQKILDAIKRQHGDRSIMKRTLRKAHKGRPLYPCYSWQTLHVTKAMKKCDIIKLLRR